MSSVSTYDLTCVCGQHIVSATRRCKCINCGRHISIEWQAKTDIKPPVQTITDKLEQDGTLPKLQEHK